VKPEIVFYGENLESDFYVQRGALKREGCDLIITLGSSLAVAPFNHIP
jgi:NAD-dependent SIR2 family protein deacetylase